MTDHNETLQMLLKDEVLFPCLIAGTILLVTLIRSVAGVAKSFARERTRREIAAFIAEGSITPDQGERLMRAGENKTGCC